MGDPQKLIVLEKAQAIADEWVTMTRLEHVIDALGGNVQIERMKDVITGMIDDVVREASSEIVDSREARKAIGEAAAKLFKTKLKDSLRNA